jgi:hypothetical protein
MVVSYNAVDVSQSMSTGPLKEFAQGTIKGSKSQNNCSIEISYVVGYQSVVAQIIKGSTVEGISTFRLSSVSPTFHMMVHRCARTRRKRLHSLVVRGYGFIRLFKFGKKEGHNSELAF